MGYFEQLLTRQAPDKLYHYTSVHGVSGIIRSRSVWATVVHYLNDAQEFRHAFGAARSVIHRKVKATNDSDLAALLSHLTESLERIEHVRISVFSLTEEGDLLSQWRGYCPPGGGYSMAFSPDFLRPFLHQHGFFLAPCTYKDSEHQALVEEVIDRTVQGFEAVRSASTLDVLKDKVLPGFFFNLARVAPIIKHPSFAEEREWRIVSGLITDDDPHLGHRVGKSMLIPYYELPLEAEGLPFTLAEVVVGPTPHQYIAMNALTSLIHREKVAWHAVKPSQIPYRQL